MSAISDKYNALGGPTGFLGAPTGPESSTPDGVGRFEHYQFGSIYWTPQTGAHEVHGAIHTKWASLGWENFGYPTTDESGTPDGVGRFNHFHNIQNSGDSSIYWTPQTGAHEVHGAIRDAWAGLGWERSSLGYPTSDEYQTPDLTWESSQFQRGSIIWSRINWPTQPGAQAHSAGQPNSLGGSSPLWGLLANPGFESRAVKSVYFFAGNWKFGDQIFYESISPSPNDEIYTLHPTDARHLGWSEQQVNRDFALRAMGAAGVNVIDLSYWGKRGTDRWAFWAPMQCSTYAHDQVFDTALSHNLLITPSIESAAATNLNPQTGKPYQCGVPPNVHSGDSPAYFFSNDFPGNSMNPAPGFVEQILDLVNRYLLAPQNPQWRSRWTQLYDRTGRARYAIAVIQASSTQPGINDGSFAAGLDAVADLISRETGIQVGFMLDPLPGNAYSLTPSSGAALAQTKSFLAIKPFISEIAMGTDDLRTLLPMKQNLVEAWLAAGVPFLLDVSPGYDAHIVFPAKNNAYWRIANNDIWHNGQTQMIACTAGGNSIRGIAFNTWNGYTEGYAAPSTLEFGSQAFTWLQSLLQLLP